MPHTHSKPLLIIATLTLLTTVDISCRKDPYIKGSTLNNLYKDYKYGQISECKYQGKLVYTAIWSAYDAGSNVYAEDGKVLGSCNYAWNHVDSICTQLTDCEVVYRVGNNIWGLPAVDKYGLGK